MATPTDKILALVQNVAEGNPDYTAKDVAEISGVHYSSVKTAMAILRARGVLPRKPHKWAELIAEVKANPDATTLELAKAYKLTENDVSNILSRYRNAGVDVPYIGITSAKNKAIRVARRREDILNCMRGGALDLKAIAEITGHSQSAVQREVKAMEAEGVVKYMGWVIV